MNDAALGVFREHRTEYNGRWWCACGHEYGLPRNVSMSVEQHRIEAALSDGWDECLELLENNSEIDLDDLEHYKEVNPYRKQEEA